MSCHCCVKAGNSVVPHTPLTCAYRKSLYCSICADYGHAPRCCPNQKALAIRKGKNPDGVENRILYVLHKHAAVKHVLQLHGITPLATFPENKHLLTQLAYSFEEPKMVVYRLY